MPTLDFIETDGGISRIFEYNPSNCVHLQTEKQVAQILDTTVFGPTLFLDGVLQSAVKDEYLYHEMLVHPLMSCLGPDDRDRIAIFGGGEGCTAREVFHWPFVGDVRMYDYDRQLVMYFKNNATPWNSTDALNDRRLHLRFSDVFQEVRYSENGRFNGLIIDLIDPEASNQWASLLRNAFHWIHSTGAMVINAGGIYPWDMKNLKFLYHIAKSHIEQQDLDFEVHAYKVFVPSFGREWAFLLIHHRPLNSFQPNHPTIRYYTPQKLQLINPEDLNSETM